MAQRGRLGRQRSERGGDVDWRLRLVADIIGPLAQSIGPHCEIVLHDYRLPDRSVVAVAGKVTQRRVGSAMSEIGLSILAEGGTARDRLNYLTTAPNGRVINSSTIVLRDGKKRIYGALCLNVDVTDLQRAAALLSTLVGDDAPPRPTTFTDDIRDVIEVALREELAGRAPKTLSRSDRLAIVRALDSRGVFYVKRAMGQVAAALGVSRATAYAFLQLIRSGGRDGTAAKAAATAPGHAGGSQAEESR